MSCAEEQTTTTPRKQKSISRYTTLDQEATADFQICNESAPSLGIVSGYEVTRENDPHNGIYCKDLHFETSYCSGVVVGSNYIVSAAHCFVKLDGDYSSLKLGKGTLGNPMSDITINNPTVHPKYSGIKYVGETGYENRVFYDIAVLTTKEKIQTHCVRFLS